MLKPRSKNSPGLLSRCAALLLAITAWPALSSAAGGLVPQHTEDLRPALTRVSKGSAASLEFTAFSRHFRLQLSANERLAKIAAGSELQLYAGTIEGAPGSWARISIHDGLPRGMIWDGRELYVVDAAPEGVNLGAAGTVMYKLSDAVLEQSVSFGDDAVDVPRDAAAAYGAVVDELRANKQMLQAGVAAEGVEISILADAAYLARYSSETQARDAILTRLNNVDGIFSSQVAVTLQVESLEIAGGITAGLSATTDSNALLEELGLLRRETPALVATGLTHLFTGRNLDGDTAGVAYTLALCSPRYAASLTQAHNSTALDTLITAHEIGHVFGAPHDGSKQCASTPQNQYIMTPMLSTSVTEFSQCSLDEIDKVLDSYSCVKSVAPAEPAPPVPPAPPPANDDGGGGGGSLDALLLLLLLALWAGRAPHRIQRCQAGVPVRFTRAVSAIRPPFIDPSISSAPMSAKTRSRKKIGREFPYQS